MDLNMSDLKFICNSCEKELDFEKLSFSIISTNNDYKRFCRDCRTGKSTAHDVFWDGKPEENLADDPITGKPRVFSSKGEKAAYLKEKGLVEAGDRVHGAPLEAHKNQEIKRNDSRHEVKMALKKIKEMGIDVRRQEYLKIK